MDKAESVIKRAHIFIEGKVQGVGFRYFVQTNAKNMDLAGWVKNLPDGRVEALLEGPKAKVINMVEKCRKGPRAGHVDNIDLQWQKTDEALNGFRVKYS